MKENCVSEPLSVRMFSNTSAVDTCSILSMLEVPHTTGQKIGPCSAPLRRHMPALRAYYYSRHSWVYRLQHRQLVSCPRRLHDDRSKVFRSSWTLCVLIRCHRPCPASLASPTHHLRHGHLDPIVRHMYVLLNLRRSPSPFFSFHPLVIHVLGEQVESRADVVKHFPCHFCGPLILL